MSANAPRQWTVGRAPECDIQLDAPGVSWRHCTLLESAGGQLLLRDLGSTNGTFVNGNRVAGQILITPADQVTLGATCRLPWPAPALPSPPLANRPETVRAAPPPSLPKFTPQPSFRTPPPLPPLPPPAALAANRTSATVFQNIPSVGQSRAIRIGRDAGNDIVLDYPTVSARHAELRQTGDRLELIDLQSTNGLAVGRRDNRITQATISPADTVFFGSLAVPAARLLQVGGKFGESSYQSLDIGKTPLVFGRDPTCDQVLDSPAVSRFHASITAADDGFWVQDLRSSNGTFVNGRRVVGRQFAKAGDVVGLGAFAFRLGASRTIEKRDYRGDVTVEARGIVVEAGGRRLLDQISLTIYPSEFVALMGPSGAGKTTLMNVLNGYTRPAQGEVFINGKDLYSHYAQFARQIGYVPQDDIIHRELTVGEALYYTGRLRLPADYSEGELRQRVQEVLRLVELEHVANVLIGSPERKGISGGQRKRVNLAMELLTDPMLLFLDEPTSGLSSEDTLMVMKLLRNLANSGKTILLTIHQPSLEAYRQLDNLVLVSKDKGTADPGKLVYYGPAYPDAVGFFNAEMARTADKDPSPDEVLRGLAKQKTSHWTSSYAQSGYHREYVAERAGKQAGGLPRQGLQSPPHDWGFGQCLTLLRRAFAIKLKDVWNTLILAAQAPVVAILLVLVFHEQTSLDLQRDRQVSHPQVVSQEYREKFQHLGTTVFLLSIAALWFGCSNSVREIVGEWAIYHRERMVNLKIPSYLASKFAILSALCLLQCVVLLAAVHVGCELKGSFLFMLGLLFLIACVGVAIGLVISTFARTSEVAVSLLPIVLLPMVILGGALLPQHEMPAIAGAMSNLTPSRWAFEGELLLESEAQEHDPNDEDLAERFFPKKEWRFGVRDCALILFSMLCLFVSIAGITLRAKDLH